MYLTIVLTLRIQIVMRYNFLGIYICIYILHCELSYESTLNLR